MNIDFLDDDSLSKRESLYRKLLLGLIRDIALFYCDVEEKSIANENLFKAAILNASISNLESMIEFMIKMIHEENARIITALDSLDE